MAFNQNVVKNSFTGTATAYSSPITGVNGAKIALNGITTGNTTSAAGLVLNPGGLQNVEWESLCALVEVNVTTTSLAVVSKWQVSNDGTNWIDLFTKNVAANVQKPATGTGSPVTTQYVQSLDGWNPCFPYLRLAVVSTGATGGAADSITVSYNFRKRSIAFG